MTMPPEVVNGRPRPKVGFEQGTIFDYIAGDLIFSAIPGEPTNEGLVYEYRTPTVGQLREMLDHDGRARSFEQCLIMPIAGAEWRVEGEDQTIADWVDDILRRDTLEGGMETPMSDVLAQKAEAFVFRVSYHEKVWKLTPDDKVGYAKIAWRPPDTCNLRREKTSGELRGFAQWVLGNVNQVLIDLPYADVYIHGARRDPNRGISDLTVTYHNYRIKEKLKFLWYCVNLDTMILTRRGWLKHDEVRVGDETLGYDTKAQCTRWTTIREVSHFDDAPLQRIACDRWSHTCTPNHRLIFERLRSSTKEWEPGYFAPASKEMYSVHGNLSTMRRIRVAAPLVDEDRSGLTPYEAALYAWLLTDGCVSWFQSPSQPHGVAASVIQSKERGRRAVEGLWRRMGLTPKWTGSSAHPSNTIYVPMHIFWPLCEKVGIEYGKPFESTVLETVLKMGPKQLRAFAKTAYIAEGAQSESGDLRFWQNPGQVMDAVQLAFFMLGSRVGKQRYYDYGERVRTFKDGRTFTSEDHCGSFSINESQPFVRVASLRVQDVDRGPVWCVRTDLGSWTCMHEGHISLTGNTYCEVLSLPRQIVLANSEADGRKAANAIAALKNAGVAGIPKSWVSDIKEISVAGSGATDFQDAIAYLDSDSALSLLAGFSELPARAMGSGSSHGPLGSYALAESAQNFFVDMLDAYGEEINSQITSSIIADLVRFNYGTKVKIPRFKLDLEAQAVQNAMSLLQHLLTAPAPTNVPQEFVKELTLMVAKHLGMDTTAIHKAIVQQQAQLEQQAKTEQQQKAAPIVAATDVGAQVAQQAQTEMV